MKRLQTPKACAALVLIAWLASVVSLWGFGPAAERAIAKDEPRDCSVQDLKHRSIQMEMASGAQEVVDALEGGDCIRRGKIAEIAYADSFFLVSYSLLILFLFLFVRALAASPRAYLILGIVLALATAAGDLVENIHLVKMIRLAGEAGPPLGRIDALLPGLKTAAFVKMSAAGLSTLILGLLWPARSRWVWVPRLLGILTAALFAGAMLLDVFDNALDWKLAGDGIGAFALFAFSAVIHAVATLVDRER